MTIAFEQFHADFLRKIHDFTRGDLDGRIMMKYDVHGTRKDQPRQGETL